METKKKVLVVEDDKYTNELICMTLRMSGMEVTSVFNGEDAILKAEEIVPDIIVLDLLIPKLDGWEVCRRLRQDGSITRHIPIIIASIASRYDIEGASSSMGMLSFFNKPFEPKELAAEVQRIIDSTGK